MGTYFRDLADAFISSFKGMGVTIQHFFSKPVTVQYPDERMPIADAFLGKHLLEQEKCIACKACVKICPVDCLALEADRRPGKVLDWKSFTVNYNYCMFCGLCVEACPTDALHMTKEYDLSVEDRRACTLDLLSWKGLRPEDLEKIAAAEKAAAEKKRKAAEAKAAEAAAEKAGEGEAQAERARKGKGAGDKDKEPGKEKGGGKDAAPPGAGKGNGTGGGGAGGTPSTEP